MSARQTGVEFRTILPNQLLCPREPARFSLTLKTKCETVELNRNLFHGKGFEEKTKKEVTINFNKIKRKEGDLEEGWGKTTLNKYCMKIYNTWK